MKIVRTAAVGTALASLAFAGAAQAENRSGAAMPAYTPVSAAQAVSRGSATAEGESDIRGPGIVLAILAIIAIILAIVIAADGGGFDSPG